jgi:hypothetical protein
MAVLAAASVVVSIAGCQKSPGPAPISATNMPASNPIPSVATSGDVPSLPPECRALLAALQRCSDHLTATNAVGAAPYRVAVDQARAGMPLAEGDPSLAQQCANSLKEQGVNARDLGC